MTKSYSAMLRVILVNLALVALLLVISFVAIETVLRMYIPDTDHTGMNELAPAPLYYRIKPDFDAVLEGVKVTTNSDGYRDDAFEKRKPENKQLIAVIGDSIAFGQGVPQAQTFPSRLEKLLNSSLTADKKYAVWNMGVPGYNTWQEYEVLKSLLEMADPDWVFLAYVINDVEPVNQDALKLLSGENNKSSSHGIFRNSIAIQIARNRLGRVVRWFKPEWYFSSYVEDTVLQYMDPQGPWKEVSNIIKSMQMLCDQKKIRFTVVMTPTMMDFNNYPFLEINQKMKNFCRQNGIDYLDVLPYFMGLDHQRLVVSMIDSHPNAQAQEIIARALMDHIEKRKSGN